MENNANDLAEVLGKKNIEVEVVKREINDNTLYCVWIKGNDDYTMTKDIAEDIKSRYKLTYRILKP
jgi:hypothetical protein